MANIAIIKLFYGMSITGAQLAGELLKFGHSPRVIFFKKQEVVKLEDCSDAAYQLGDVPMRNHFIGNEDDYVVETSIWKKTRPQELQHLVTCLKEFSPDAIGISTLSLGMTLAAEVTEHLRQHFDVPVLWGGTGPTLEPDRSIQHADLVCVGEGEGVLVDIARRLDEGQSLDGIAGTWFRQRDGSTQKNPKREVSDLEQIAVPCWEDQYFYYINGPRFERMLRPDAHSIDKSYQIMTQRGCPFSCSFCVESFYQNEFGKKNSLRRMSPEKAIRELKYARDTLGYKTVTFMDDVFTVNPRWLGIFLEHYKREIDLPFFCYTYPTTHNPQVLAMLEKAGCHGITMGVQSGSQEILTRIYERPTKLGRVVEAAREIEASGIPAATFDMIPYTAFDKEDDLRETLEILLEIPKSIDTTFYGQMAYFPNYPIQDKFQDAELLARSEHLDDKTYAYYFKLFDLTRTDMPVEKIREIAADPKYRANHKLLNPFINAGSRLKPSYGTLTELGVARRKAALCQ